MQATPVWFGPGDRPLLGWLHSTEDSMARAGVVVCPPLGADYPQTHATLRELAEDLAARRFSVLRFDYDGTGNSAGSSMDPNRVTAWLGSVREAVTMLRNCGHACVMVVGVRFGALLAALASDEDGAIDGLVLWDAPVSGRAYLVEQKMLAERSLYGSSSRADEGLELPGMTLGAAAVADIEAIKLSLGSNGLARHLLVLQRAERASAQLNSRLSAPHVDWAEAVGQQLVIEKGFNCGLVAREINGTVVEWVSRIAPRQTVEVESPPVAGQAIVGWTRAREPIVETPTFLGGGEGPFGILTEVRGNASKTTVLFLYGSVLPWVEWARRWAEAGLRCFRLDMSGMGESPARSEQLRRGLLRMPEHFDDVLQACSELNPENPSDAVLVGLCAGAYQALDSAIRIRPRGVVALNPVIRFKLPEVQLGGRPDPRRRVAVPRDSVSFDDRLRAHYHYSVTRDQDPSQRPVGYQSFLSKLHSARAPIPMRVRQFVGRVRSSRSSLSLRSQMAAAPGRRPSTWLKELLDGGVDISLVCGKNERREVLFGVTDELLDSFASTGNFHLQYIADLEHSHFSSDRREELGDQLMHHLTARFGGTPSQRYQAARSSVADHSQ